MSEDNRIYGEDFDGYFEDGTEFSFYGWDDYAGNGFFGECGPTATYPVMTIDFWDHDSGSKNDPVGWCVWL